MYRVRQRIPGYVQLSKVQGGRQCMSLSVREGLMSNLSHNHFNYRWDGEQMKDTGRNGFIQI